MAAPVEVGAGGGEAPAPAQTHVLLVAFSSQGHINPMLHLARHLAAHGLVPTLATTEVTRHRLLKASTTSSSSPSPIRLAFFSDGLDIDFDRRSDLNTFFSHLRSFGPANLSGVVATHSPKFSCLITTPFLPWVADVAAEHGLPCALFWIQPLSLLALYHLFFLDPSRFHAGIREEGHETIDLPGLPAMKKSDLPTFVLPSNTLTHITDLFSELFVTTIWKMKWVLVNSFHELEKDAADSMAVAGLRTLPIGPLVPPVLLQEKGERGSADDNEETGTFDMWKADDGCLRWLDGFPAGSVVYVSFGSLVFLPAPQMEELAAALRDCGRPFLWVVKPPDYGGAKVASLPEGFAEETEGRGVVVEWCPQARILRHPAVGCFLTHCGWWNSMLESVAAGVPLVAFPQWTDQPTNAKLAEEVFGVGVRVARKPEGDGVVSGGEIRRCIEEVIGGGEVAEERRARAAGWKETARAAVREGGSSKGNIRTFVAEMREPQMSLS